MEQIYAWEAIDRPVDIFTGPDRCNYFEKELWFKLGNSMWRKHQKTFQDHVKYIHNDIVKSFRVGILQYADCIFKMHELAKYLPPPLTKGRYYNQVDWTDHEKESSENEIIVITKDRLPRCIQDELEDKIEDYCSILHE